MLLGYTAAGESSLFTEYQGNDSLGAGVTALALHESGSIFTAGRLQSSATLTDVLVAKFAVTSGCCQGTRGNINIAGIVDLSDLSLLIQYLTVPGTPIPCVDAANVNATDIIAISDLAQMISYLVGTATELPGCP